MTRAALFLALAAGLATGCGYTPTPRAAAVDFKGKLTGVDGKPLKAAVAFVPAGDGGPGGATTKDDGTFTVSLVPGKYLFYFDPATTANKAAIKAIPDKYHATAAEHMVEAAAGQDIDIKLAK